MDNPRIGSELNIGHRDPGREDVSNRKNMLDTLINRIKGISPLFLFTVVVPTLVAILYFGFFASDVYISESRFVVRSPDKPALSMW